MDVSKIMILAEIENVNKTVIINTSFISYIGTDELI